MASRRWNAFSVCTRSVSFVAAAGDQSAVPLYPSVSSQVLSTGGTSLILSSAGVRISETAWYGGGGGTSQFFPLPRRRSYGRNPEKTGGMRGTPDVSFCADPDYGVAIYHSASISGASGWGKAGGTSFAAPAWAAVLAGIRQRGGTSNPQDLYRLARRKPSIWNHSHILSTSCRGKAACTRLRRAGICAPVWVPPE